MFANVPHERFLAAFGFVLAKYRIVGNMVVAIRFSLQND